MEQQKQGASAGVPRGTPSEDLNLKQRRRVLERLLLVLRRRTALWDLEPILSKEVRESLAWSEHEMRKDETSEKVQMKIRKIKKK